jgi:deoxyinosine 3'endonuclease (endonuclease V)
MNLDEIKVKWIKEQQYLKTMLKTTDTFDNVRYIGGVDISMCEKYTKNNKETGKTVACAMIIIMSYPEMKLVYEDFIFCKINEPYMPGFLAFREIGPLLHLVVKLKKDAPEYIPDVIMVDGCGIYHPQGLGLASHLGILCDIPTIGVSKKNLAVDGINRKMTDKMAKDLHKFGDRLDLIGDTCKIWGRLLRTNSVKPIFISIGHKISLDTAVQLVIKCSKFRIPEPIRFADLGSREEVRKMLKKTNDVLPKNLVTYVPIMLNEERYSTV